MSDLRLQWDKIFSQPCSDSSSTVIQLAFTSKRALHYDAEFVTTNDCEITSLVSLLGLS